MNLLIKDATILLKDSEFHQQKRDILITDGHIARIADNISDVQAQIIKGSNLYCTIGLCDVGTHSGEPGFEHRETMDSLTRAARNGGYSALVVFPNNKPITQSKTTVNFLRNHPNRNGVEIWPVGALSQDLKGADISEYLDMVQAGAVAMSEGLVGVQDTGLINRAMQYAGSAGIPLIVHPDDHYLSREGQMHEGVMSTSLGMKGVPDIAEIQMIQRDLMVLSYNDAHIIEHGISTARGLETIRQYNEEDPRVFVTVPYLNLVHTDEDLHEFDSNLKVMPVLREHSDRIALIDGVKVGTIDAIISNHVPLDKEAKDVEFPYAVPGAIGLETCLPVLVDELKDDLDLAQIVDKLTIGPRQMLGLPIPDIIVGAQANLCVFDTNATWTYADDQIASASRNSPYLNREFHTKIVATVIGDSFVG
ncbi:MAG: amidohydrolase family protein [Saprospiraceae bacterium]|nr:MAG: dihydroorotase, multifunctional complex type [Bacteroidetes bacterium OLB9]MCO6463714.1 amidohydrolase family protein [Saprospiraceae bacterium]MCZ2337427.1 dihydroorotase [Chitinophagales bacterium]